MVFTRRKAEIEILLGPLLLQYLILKISEAVAA